MLSFLKIKISSYFYGPNNIQYLLPIQLDDICNLVTGYLEWDEHYNLLKFYDIPINLNNFFKSHECPPASTILCKPVDHYDIIKHMINVGKIKNCKPRCDGSQCENINMYISISLFSRFYNYDDISKLLDTKLNTRNIHRRGLSIPY